METLARLYLWFMELIREANAAFWEGFWNKPVAPKSWDEFCRQCAIYYYEGREWKLR